MNTMNIHYVLIGCLGGVFPDIIRLLKLGSTGDFTAPAYLKQGFFYVILVLQILFGGFIVYMLHVSDNLQAIVYGYAAPQIFTSLAAGVVRTSSDQAGMNITEPHNRSKLSIRKAIVNFY